MEQKNIFGDNQGIILMLSPENISCGYSLEWPWRENSNGIRKTCLDVCAAIFKGCKNDNLNIENYIFLIFDFVMSTQNLLF